MRAKDEGAVIGINSSIIANKLHQETNSLELIRGGSWNVYVIGAVKYTDIYRPNEKPYETTYCFILRPVPLMPNPGGAVEHDSIETCPAGNHFK